METRTHKPLGCLGILRWLVASVLIIIFTAWITVGIPLSALSRTLVDRAHIKYWLLASGIYQQPVTLISDVIVHTVPSDSPLAPVAQQAQNPDSALSKTLNTVLYPTFVQYSAQTVINATYDWLEGKTTRPNFKVALLPDVTAAETIVNQLPQNTLSVDAITQQTTVNSSDIPLDQRTSQLAQRGFVWAVLLPGIIVAVSLILLVLILIIIPNRRRSFMVVGTMLLSLGGILAITELILAANFTNILKFLFTTVLPPETAWVQQVFQAPLLLAYNDIIMRTARYSLALAALGAIFMGLAMLSQLPLHRITAKAKSKSKQYMHR